MNEPNEIYILMAITSIIGATVRIVFEWEKKTLTIKRTIFIIIAALTVAYLFYLANEHQNWISTKYIGFPSIIAGIISMEVVKFFIEDLPSLFKTFLKSKINEDPE